MAYLLAGIIAIPLLLVVPVILLLFGLGGLVRHVEGSELDDNDA